jgi:hypothetical protein
MPFDSFSFTVVDDLAVLRAARRNIAKPGKWANGEGNDGEACIVGWIAYIIARDTVLENGQRALETDRLIRDYIVPELHEDRNRKCNYQVRLLRFNDRPSTTQAVVQRYWPTSSYGFSTTLSDRPRDTQP